jgi:hypothetical protein
MSAKYGKLKQDKPWRQVLIEESDRSIRARGGRRLSSFRRMYMTVFVLFSAAFLFYCSLFYIGAFVDVGKIVGVNQQTSATNARSTALNGKMDSNPSLLTRVQDRFRANRVFLRRGQTIQASYSIPAGAEITLTIKQCKNMPVMEVFKCDVISEKTKKITRKTTGYNGFTVTSPGFYYFEETVTKLPTKTANAAYRVVWQRG